MVAGVSHVVEIDCSGVTSENEFWQRYLDAVPPEGAEIFGRNLDAFWDAVEIGGPGWPRGAELVFRGSGALASLRRADGEPFLGAIAQIAAEATRTRITLA